MFGKERVSFKIVSETGTVFQTMAHNIRNTFSSSGWHESHKLGKNSISSRPTDLIKKALN